MKKAYPRCRDEDQECISLHDKARNIRNDFWIELEEKCKKVKMYDKSNEEVKIIIDSIKGYFSDDVAGHMQ